MSKDYNIDDILAEVKKRREENEQEIKSRDNGASSIADAPEEKVEEPNPFADLFKDKPEPVVESISDEPEEEIIDISSGADDASPAPEPTPEVENNPTEEEEILETAQEAQAEQAHPAQEENGEMVDLFSIQTDVEEYADEPYSVEKKPKKKHKVLKAIIIILVLLIIGAAVGGALYINHTLNDVTNNTPDAEMNEWKGMDELVENFGAINEAEASQIASLQDMMKTWYYTGAPVSSSHVLNVLLIGEDTRGSNIIDSGTRADSAIICSINTDTNQITLTSILRDNYAYWEQNPGDEGSGTFGKINGAMVGGVKVYMNAVENLYKIKLDNYVIVNFDSFESIIDALGGVTLELTSKEINEINSHPKRYGHVTINQTFEGTKGKMKLTGKQAVAYCRIRKIDSDNKRADRQKICLMQIFDQAKDASPTKLVKVVNTLVPYIKTDMPKNSIIKVGKYALTDGWMNYKFQTCSVPNCRLNEAGGNFSFAGAWIWKADYPQDAYDIQMKIYGHTPIVLARTRVDFIRCRETGFRANGAPAVIATIQNEHYGEETTQEETTEEQQQ